GNYGWDMYEGAHCYEGPCDPEGITFPVYEYSRSGGRIAITGGYVYRGTSIPELVGKYVYGDLSGPVYALDVSGGTPVNEQLLTFTGAGVCSFGYCLSSFGEDADGELYLLGTAGAVRRLVRNPPLAGEPGPEVVAALTVVGPNPTRGRTLVRLTVQGAARPTLHDALGRRIAVLYEGTGVGAARELGVVTAALAPGVYALRLEADGTAATETLTVVR